MVGTISEEEGKCIPRDDNFVSRDGKYNFRRIPFFETTFPFPWSPVRRTSFRCLTSLRSVRQLLHSVLLPHDLGKWKVVSRKVKSAFICIPSLNTSLSYRGNIYSNEIRCVPELLEWKILCSAINNNDQHKKENWCNTSKNYERNLKKELFSIRVAFQGNESFIHVTNVFLFFQQFLTKKI